MSKAVCVSSSCKFEKDWARIKNELESHGVKVFLPSDTSYNDPAIETDSTEEKRDLMDEYNSFIDASEIFYIYAPGGYMGIGVAIEIGYAFAKEKEIISSEVIEEMGGRALATKVMDLDALKEYLKEEANV